MNWAIGTDIYTLICTKWITNKNLLYKKIKFKNSIKKKTKPQAAVGHYVFHLLLFLL